jgi:hypothetical protein
MAPPPPDPPRRAPGKTPPPGKSPEDIFGAEVFASPPPPRKRKKKKKTEPLAVRISRAMFIIGMIIGAFMSLLLPYRTYTVGFGEHHYTIPFNVVRLQMWQRWLVYGFMVMINGFLWSKVAMEVCTKYFPRTLGPPKRQEEEYEVGRKIFRLDE